MAITAATREPGAVRAPVIPSATTAGLGGYRRAVAVRQPAGADSSLGRRAWEVSGGPLCWGRGIGDE